MLNIVIFGAPGSGKGTQSERIVEKFGINHISTGDVLRAEIKKGTELGKTAKGYIDQGQLLPDELIIDILASTLDSFKESKGVIFDGFPRTIAQAEALKKMLAEREIKKQNSNQQGDATATQEETPAEQADAPAAQEEEPAS
jgi:adenylate kinase